MAKYFSFHHQWPLQDSSPGWNFSAQTTISQLIHMFVIYENQNQVKYMSNLNYEYLAHKIPEHNKWAKVICITGISACRKFVWFQVMLN